MATLELSIASRNAMLDAIDTLVNAGTGTQELRIYEGTIPDTCTTTDGANTLVVKMSLDTTNVFNAASAGAMSKNGTWSGTGEATGAPHDISTTAYFRIYDNNTGAVSGGTNSECVMQGDVGTGSQAIVVDNGNVASGQTVTISTFTLTAGNADQ